MTRLGPAGAKPPQNDIERRDAIDGTFYPAREVLSESHIVFKDRRTCPLLGKHGFIYAPMAECTALLCIARALLQSSLLGQLFICTELDGWPEFEPSTQAFLAELAENMITSRFSAWTLEVDDQPETMSHVI